MPSYSLTADGDIRPSRFVKLATGTAGRVAECDAGEQIYGVSGPSVRNAPYSTLDDGLHAVAGEGVLVYGPPEKDVMLELGGTVTRGQFLKSDADGKGVASTADQERVGAIALDSGTSGKLIPVQLLPPMERSLT